MFVIIVVEWMMSFNLQWTPGRGKSINFSQKLLHVSDVFFITQMSFHFCRQCTDLIGIHSAVPVISLHNTVKQFI